MISSVSEVLCGTDSVIDSVNTCVRQVRPRRSRSVKPLVHHTLSTAAKHTLVCDSLNIGELARIIFVFPSL